MDWLTFEQVKSEIKDLEKLKNKTLEASTKMIIEVQIETLRVVLGQIPEERLRDYEKWMSSVR